MSETKQTHDNQKDVFSAYQYNVDKLFNSAKQYVPQYHQSITNVQQEYLQILEDMSNSTISMQKEYTKKIGISTNATNAAVKTIRDTTDDIVKAATIQNQIALATIDAAQQNIKTFNDGAKMFVELNKNIFNSWFSAFPVKSN